MFFKRTLPSFGQNLSCSIQVSDTVRHCEAQLLPSLKHYHFHINILGLLCIIRIFYRSLNSEDKYLREIEN